MEVNPNFLKILLIGVLKPTVIMFIMLILQSVESLSCKEKRTPVKLTFPLSEGSFANSHNLKTMGTCL